MRLPLTGSRPGAPIRNLQHVYEIRPRKDRRGFDVTSDALPFGSLCWNVGFAYGFSLFFTNFIMIEIRAFV